jgi:hypothetical protein
MAHGGKMRAGEQLDVVTNASESEKERAQQIAGCVEQFVRDIVIPYERDARRTTHGPIDELVQEMRARARTAPTEVHKWALAKKIKRDHLSERA